MVLVAASLAIASLSAVIARPAPYAGPLRQSEQLRRDNDKERVRYLQELMKYGADRTDPYSVVAGWCNVMGMNAAQLAERRADATFGLR